jgi:AcrR family transcriptional regulator
LAEGKMKTNFGVTRHEHKSEDSAAPQIEGPECLAFPDRRSQALRTAATQFAVTGLHGTTSLVLAKATGISEGILYAYFGGKVGLFRAAVEDNIRTRLQLLETRTLSAAYESETAAVRRIAEATVTVCAAGPGNSILMNWALMEDHRYAADLYRDEIGSVEILWNRAFAESFGNSRSCRVFSVDLLPYAVIACLAYGFWLATLRQDSEGAAALAQGFVAGIVQTASALLSEQNEGMCRVKSD